MRRAPRRAISGTQKEAICNYARVNPHASNSTILAWARATIHADFPQPSLSTVLSKNGIITYKSGSRGRPPSRRTKNFLNNEVGYSNTDACNFQQVEQIEYMMRSERTGILVKDLLQLVGNRCRERSSGYKDIEILLLEEIYHVLCVGQYLITYEFIRKHTFQLIKKKRPHYQQKYLCQFLDGLAGKYFLLNVAFQYLRPRPSLEPQMTYQEMLKKLSTKFPGLCFAPIVESTETSSASQDSSVNENKHVSITEHTGQCPQFLDSNYTSTPYVLAENNNAVQNQDFMLFPQYIPNFSVLHSHEMYPDLCEITPSQFSQYFFLNK